MYAGFDNTGVWGWGDGPFVTPREDGRFYERSWEMALSNDIRLVQIATWNDFGEGAVIEPTVDFKYQYLQITERYAAQLKKIPSDSGEALLIPLKIYEMRLAIAKRDAEDRARLSAELDSAVSAFCRGNYAEAERMLQKLEN